MSRMSSQAVFFQAGNEAPETMFTALLLAGVGILDDLVSVPRAFARSENGELQMWLIPSRAG